MEEEQQGAWKVTLLGLAGPQMAWRLVALLCFGRHMPPHPRTHTHTAPHRPVQHDGR